MDEANDVRGGRRAEADDAGARPLAAHDPARIGPYLLLGRLGAGGMGRVFLARADSGRTVAVKVVHEEHAADTRFRVRFRREIKAVQKVDARFTAPVLGAGPDDEPPWVATGYVPGLSLEQVVSGHGPLPVDSVHALCDGLLHALRDIHAARIVHRDLKPSNVMLTVDGVKVIDFGIARAVGTCAESMLTTAGVAVGTPGFMSPEQVRGEQVGARSDVFTLGCVLAYAATGRMPFGHGAGSGHAVMYQIAEGEPDLRGIDDPALRSLVLRCLTKDAEQRPGVDSLLADPERARPAATGAGVWLPAAVVARLAQQSARLLDAEAAVPVRDAGVGPGADVDPGSDVKRGAGSDSGAGSGSGAGPDSDPGSDPDPGARPAPEPGSGQAAGSGSGQPSGSGSGRAAGPGSGPASGAPQPQASMRKDPAPGALTPGPKAPPPSAESAEEPEPEASALADPEGSAPADPRTPAPAEPEVPAPADPEASASTEPEVPAQAELEAPAPADPEGLTRGLEGSTPGPEGSTPGPEVAPPGPESPPAQRPNRSRRRLLVALSLAAVLAVAGGTLAVRAQLHADGDDARPESRGPAAGASAAASRSPASPSASASRAAKGHRKKPKQSPTPTAGDPAASATAGSDRSGTESGGAGTGTTTGSGSGTASGAHEDTARGTAGSPPPDLQGYAYRFNGYCFGACSFPLTLSWSAVSRATRYDIRYTNKGSQNARKNVSKVLSTSNTTYTINGPYSGDRICVAVRAANKYGPSAWEDTWCGTVPY